MAPLKYNKRPSRIRRQIFEQYGTNIRTLRKVLRSCLLYRYQFGRNEAMDLYIHVLNNFIKQTEKTRNNGQKNNRLDR